MPIPYSRQWIDSDDIDAVVAALKQDFITQGPSLEAFEHELCVITGVKHAIAVVNGSAALHLAVAAMGIGLDDVGITTPITFAASANCFRYQNAEVLFSDVDPLTGLMDVGFLESTIQKVQKKGALIPVSLQGRVPDLPKIAALAQKYGFRVIEDAAHSLGSWYEEGGRSYPSGCCMHSDMAILSFHPVKHICTGEGGAVLTNDDALADRVRLLRSHGIQRPHQEDEPSWFYDQVDLGWNYRMNEIQAALGLSQLKKLDKFLDRRRFLAERYYETFSKAPFSEVFKMAPRDPGNSYHLFVIHFEDQSTRNEACDVLKEKGILTQVHYRPLYQFSYYDKHAALPGSEAYYEGCLSIPIFPKMRDDEQKSVIEAIREFCFNKKKFLV